MCVIGAKLVKGSVNHALIPVFKPHTHNLLIQRQRYDYLHIVHIKKLHTYNRLSVLSSGVGGATCLSDKVGRGWNRTRATNCMGTCRYKSNDFTMSATTIEDYLVI